MSSDIAFLPPATPQKAIALSIISNWYCIYRRQHRVDRHQYRIYRHQYRIYRRQNRFDRHQHRIYRRQNRFDRHQHRFDEFLRLNPTYNECDRTHTNF
ncbi:hypothetical protein H6G04_31145 [Calothrix membranacea FACHB-236]|nr:hypothetical protein [Calothrix membranacea FACHB-236]